MSKTSKTSKVDTSTTTSTIATASRNALFVRIDAYDSATSTSDAAILDVKWQGFGPRVDALSALGAFLMGASIAGKLSADKQTSEGIRKALCSVKDSGIYLADESDRKRVPSQSVLSRAIDIAADDTAARRAAYVALGDRVRPDVQDYVPWLKIAAGKSLGNASKVDESATRKGGTGGMPGPIVRKPGTPRTSGKVDTQTSTVDAPIAAIVPEWGIMSTWDDEQLTSVEQVADLSHIPADKRAAIARQLIAMLLIDERANKRSELAITITV